MSKASAHRCMHRLARAINVVLKADYLHLPSLRKLQQNERYLRRKYHLPGFGFAVDGVFLNFQERPKKIPRNRVGQQFFSRKFRYAINAQVVGGPDGLIYDLNLGSPGSFTDSTTWRCSGI